MKKLVLNRYFVASLLVVILVFSMWFFKYQAASVGSNTWGNFGSYVGGVAGALLSFLSILLLIETLVSQKELSTTSQFEVTFFELFKLQREIISTLEGRVLTSYEEHSEFVEKKGKDYLEAMSSLFSSNFPGDASETVQSNVVYTITDKLKSKMDFVKSLDKNAELRLIREKVYKLNTNDNYDFEHYFRSLYHLISYVDKSSVKNKNKYIDIIQAFMSDYELHLVMYNALTYYQEEQFQKLIDKYYFLRNIKSRGLRFEAHLRMFYPVSYTVYRLKTGLAQFRTLGTTEHL